MPSLNIANIRPASLKAKEVADKNYVDNKVATEISNAPFVTATEVANAIATNTTTIDGSRIVTGSIGADKIKVDTLTLSRDNKIFINNNGIFVRDNLGVLRIAIGDLSKIANNAYETGSGIV
jgi:hypothetical protein